LLPVCNKGGELLAHDFVCLGGDEDVLHVEGIDVIEEDEREREESHVETVVCKRIRVWCTSTSVRLTTKVDISTMSVEGSFYLCGYTVRY